MRPEHRRRLRELFGHVDAAAHAELVVLAESISHPDLRGDGAAQRTLLERFEQAVLTAARNAASVEIDNPTR